MQLNDSKKKIKWQQPVKKQTIGWRVKKSDRTCASSVANGFPTLGDPLSPPGSQPYSRPKIHLASCQLHAATCYEIPESTERVNKDS